MVRESYFHKLFIGRSKRFWAGLLIIGILLIPFRLTIAPERKFRITDLNGLPIEGVKVRQTWYQGALGLRKEVNMFPALNGEVLFPKRTVLTNAFLLVFAGAMEFMALRHEATLRSYEMVGIFADGYESKWVYDGKGLESGVIILKKK